MNNVTYINKRISEFFIPSPKFVHKDTTLITTLDLMKRFKIGSILVINDSARLCGIFTERDLLLKVSVNEVTDQMRVSEFMTEDPKVLSVEHLLSDAVTLMSVYGFRHIPIVNQNGHPVGIISVKDIVNVLADEDKLKYLKTA